MGLAWIWVSPGPGERRSLVRMGRADVGLGRLYACVGAGRRLGG